MSDEHDQDARAPLRLRSSAATVPPDAEAIGEEDESRAPIRLIPGDRDNDIARAKAESLLRADALAAARVERKLRGRTGTGLIVEEVEIVDSDIESLKTLDDQLSYVRAKLGNVAALSGAPFSDDEAAAPAVTAIMQHCDGFDARDFAVVVRVLRGTAEPSPVLLRHAVDALAGAYERWNLKRMAAEVNAAAAAAGLQRRARETDEELDARVLGEALEHYDRDVSGDDLELDETSDDGQIPASHEGAPPSEPLLTDEERDALNAAAEAPAASFEPVRVHRHRTRSARHHAQSAPETAPAHEPKLATVPAREKRKHPELWALAALLIALGGLAMAYLMHEDVAIRTASEARDAAQDTRLDAHDASLRRHADTLARLAPALAEKDAEILDLTNQRDNYAQLAEDSKDAIDTLDRRLGGQVGGLARELSETRSELRRKVDDQARQLEALRSELETRASEAAPAPAPAPTPNR